MSGNVIWRAAEPSLYRFTVRCTPERYAAIREEARRAGVDLTHPTALGEFVQAHFDRLDFVPPRAGPARTGRPSDRARRLLAAVEDLAGPDGAIALRHAALAIEADIPRETVAYHLAELRDYGLIEQLRTGGKHRPGVWRLLVRREAAE